jgi:DNA-binding NtrC family response regulator
MGAGIGIVHGDEGLRRSLGARLRRARFRVYLTGDPREMRGWLGKKRIDVVLVGLTSLGRGALTVVEAVTNSRREAEAILLNDNDDISLAIAGMKAGAFSEIRAPFDMAELVERISRAWQAVRARRAVRPRRSAVVRAREMMAAITFAEAGEHDTARSIMDGDRSQPRGHDAERDREPTEPQAQPRRG